MTSLAPPAVPLSQLGRAAHDLGLAGLLGGNLYGRLALHPSVTQISDPAERGKVVNAAWRRYGTVNSLSLAAVAAGWAGARASEARDDTALARRAAARPGEGRARRRRRGRPALATAVEGVRFSRDGAGRRRAADATATTPPSAPRPARRSASGG